MSNDGPIMILEDDADDQDLIKEGFETIGVKNKLIFFINAIDAFDCLLTTTDQPFLILTDMNLPAVNGLEFQRKIQENEYMRRKCIPFIFFTTSNQESIVIKAYDQQVQGFFQKPADFKVLCDTLSSIVHYWKRCLHPNSQFA